MKKIKYLLFIIPLFLIFLGNIKAFDIHTENGVTITERTIGLDFLNDYPNFDFSLTPNVFCQSFSHTTRCIFTSDRQYSTNVSNSSNVNGWVDAPFYSYIYNFNTNTYSITYYSSNSTFSFGACSSYPCYVNYDSTRTFLQKTLDFTNAFLPEEPEEPEPEEPTIENKIYLPDELQEGNCPIILDKDTIRVYEEEPQINVSVDYIDYFINSHYIKQTGSIALTEAISCLPITDFTTAYVYRFDFDKILIIFMILLFIFTYIIMKIIHSFFIGFKRR